MHKHTHHTIDKTAENKYWQNQSRNTDTAAASREDNASAGRADASPSAWERAKHVLTETWHRLEHALPGSAHRHH